MKRLKRSLKIFACCMACCVAVINGSSLKAEAAVNPWSCEHNFVEMVSVVGHYTDTHVICECCNNVCTRYHDVVRIANYCTKCNYIEKQWVEDIVQTHSSAVCKEILGQK